MLLSFLLLLLPIFLILIFYGMYVSLIKKRNKVQEAFSSIDVQLKKRYDLIPNLLKSAQKYMEYEKGLLEEITALRAKAISVPDGVENIDKKIALDKQITQKLGQLNVAMENYPQLKADETITLAMKTMSEVEEYISAARRFYNSAAIELKNAVEIFPSSMVAACIGVKAVDFFEIEEKERQSINVSDYLK